MTMKCAGCGKIISWWEQFWSLCWCDAPGCKVKCCMECRDKVLKICDTCESEFCSEHINNLDVHDHTLDDDCDYEGGSCFDDTIDFSEEIAGWNQTELLRAIVIMNFDNGAFNFKILKKMVKGEHK